MFFYILPTDIFLPTPDSLLVNLHESKEVCLLKIYHEISRGKHSKQRFLLNFEFKPIFIILNFNATF